MAILADFAISPDFLGDAFYTGATALEVTSLTATRAVLRNPGTGAVTILTGTGLSATAGGTPVAGTLTGFEIRVAGGTGTGEVPTFQASGLAWRAAEFLGTVHDAVRPGTPDFTRLEALLSRQPLTYDARSAGTGVDFGFPGVTSAITMVGSDHEDTLWGAGATTPSTPVHRPASRSSSPRAATTPSTCAGLGRPPGWRSTMACWTARCRSAWTVWRIRAA